MFPDHFVNERLLDILLVSILVYLAILIIQMLKSSSTDTSIPLMKRNLTFALKHLFYTQKIVLQGLR